MNKHIQILIAEIQDVNAQLAVTRCDEDRYAVLWGQLQLLTKLLAEEMALQDEQEAAA